ncbi:MAG: SDR family oxidoreductase [Thermoleophilia bacterium]|nr:SDR family oxidoreductase [Thermoleophilia bacterium]
MSELERPLNGEVVLITGGAGGIGSATARALVRAGARVALGDLDHAAAEQLADDLGPGNIGGRVDVTDIESFEAFAERAETEVGPISALINNAGVMILGPLDEETAAVTATEIAVNLTGVINGTKIAMKLMKPRRRGRIVNIASQAGKAGFPGGATYCATKFAVVGLCDAVRNELHNTGVGVTCVMPAAVDTELGAGLSQARGVDLLKPEEVADAITRAIARGESEVYLPRFTRLLTSPIALLPAGGRDFFLRAFKADEVLTKVDTAGRAEYQEKASKAG